MKFEIKRDGFETIPENEMDVAFIEDTVGLKREKELIALSRIPNAENEKFKYFFRKKKNEIRNT